MVKSPKPAPAPLSFRVDPALKAELEILAHDDRRTLSQYVQIVLEKHVMQERERWAGKRARAVDKKVT